MLGRSDRLTDELSTIDRAGEARDGGVRHDDALAVVNENTVGREFDEALVTLL